MVRIRLSRFGRHKRPFYRIHAVDMRRKRDGQFLENLGWYDPMAIDASKQVSLKEDRIKHWLSVGAQPSDTMNDILARHEIIDAEAWRAERQRRIAGKVKKQQEAAEAAAAASSAGEGESAEG